MKKFFILIIALSLNFYSCSPSSSNSEDDTEDPDESGFAMTAKINGVAFQANNPFGTNEFSDHTIWTYYPEGEFIMLQGRQIGNLGLAEINIWLKVDEIAEGTYEIGKETLDVKSSHYLGLIYPANGDSEFTKEGTIVITEVNTSTKIVKGTFEFITIPELEEQNVPVNFTITDGKFRYTYE